ncbi:SprT-like domain-containing protein [Pseudomonadota bacterium]
MQTQLEFNFLQDVPQDADSLQQRVITHSRMLVAMAKKHWPDAVIPNIKSTFKLRGHAAGTACSVSNTIDYNFYLLDKYREAFINEIVPHEVAHIVASKIYKGYRRPHGPEWQAVVRFFGAIPRVTHSFETKTARRIKRYPYLCGCDKPHLFTIRSHRRAQRKYVEYTCKVCKEILVYSRTGHTIR